MTTETSTATAPTESTLHGRVVWVTGASRGLGAAIASAFCAAGASVAVSARDASALGDFVQESEALPGSVFGLPCDVSDAHAVGLAARRIHDELGPVSTLVNAAGVSPTVGRSESLADHRWAQVLDINLSGTFYCCREVGRQMLEAGSGAIVNISSVHGSVGLPRMAAYAASKGGVETLTKALAVEWADRGVRVNCLAPGYFQTALTESYLSSSHGQHIADTIPMRRVGQPHELVAAALYLGSNASSYVTGATLTVDGGWSGAVSSTVHLPDPAADLDLAVRGGRVVTAAGDGPADIGIRDGRVVQIGLSVGPSRRTIDATGRLVLPGAIDAHVHFTPVQTADRRLAWADDYRTGSRAAAAGGVTTFGDIAFALPDEPLLGAMRRIAAEAQATSLVDFMLHPVMLDPTRARLQEIGQLAEAGFTSMKIFMHMGGFDARAGEYLEALETAGRAHLLTMVHAEDACTIGHLTQRLVAAGETAIANFPRTRPVIAESVAVERAVALAEISGAPIYLVHISSSAAVEAAGRARARGLPVYIETRPIYLLFDESRFGGPDPGLYVGNPPLRAPSDVDALWAGLENGRIATCCTDHAPWRRADKLDATVDITNTRPGMADLETLMSSLWSEGVARGRLSRQRFVEVTSTNAARLFDIYPRKGTIAVGSDADIVVFDPDQRWTVRGADLETAARTTLLEGRQLVGRPMVTISRGTVVMENGRITHDGARGRHITRSAA